MGHGKRAFAALIALRNDKRIDGSHIGVMGVSKGGIVAQHSAISVRQKWRGTGDLAFAVHVPIVPDCAIQHRDVSTTGRPIFTCWRSLMITTLRNSAKTTLTA
jgi:hypothetical protein